MPAAAVGAVGMPVNEGEAIGAFNNKSFVLDVTLVSSPEMAFVFVFMLDVFAFTLLVNTDSAVLALMTSAVIIFAFNLTLASKSEIAVLLELISAVLAKTLVSSPVIKLVFDVILKVLD